MTELLPPSDRDPQWLKPDYSALPQSLKDNYRWAVFKATPRPGKPGKFDKPPRNPVTFTKMGTNNPDNFGSFDDAQATLRKAPDRWTGAGIILCGDDLIGIDVDDALTLLAERPDFTKWLGEVIASENPPYLEVSPSGTGLRMLVRGKFSGPGRKKDNLEIYNTARFMTLTGHVWARAEVVTELPIRQDVVDGFLALIPESRGVNRPASLAQEQPSIFTTKAGGNPVVSVFKSKYPDLWAGNWEKLGYTSQSEADFALLGHICRNLHEQNRGGEVDGETVRAIFEESGLYRPDKHKTLVNHSIPNILSATCARNGHATRSPPTIQEHLRAKFALAKLGGQIYMLEMDNVASVQRGDPKAQLQFIEMPAGKLLLRREIESQPPTSELVKELLDDFFVNPATKVYSAVAFSPLSVPADTLNLWPSPIVTPSKGCWDVIDEFLFMVICDGDQALYRYLIHYLAHMLQRPEDKPGVMIVLMGDEGVGKGFFLRLLKAIWGRSALLVQDMDSVVGQFNKPLETAFVVCLDEALFVGDRKAQDKLKSMITEPTIQIEQKYEPRRTIDSFHRFIATTNRDHFAQIRAEDRRYLFIRVSNAHQQDQDYFATLSDSLRDDTTVPAFADHLWSVDLTGFNPRQKPVTTERLEQKILSLTGFPRYWFEVLCEGKLDGTQHYSKPWQQGDFVQASTIVSNYKEYDRSANRYIAPQSSTIYKELAKMCPSAKARRHDNKRGVELPALDQARKEFELYLGDGIEWPI